jgi:hypothetical protein
MFRAFQQMRSWRKYEIQRPQPGVLTYRQGGTEYRFPIFDENGEVVFVAFPTSKRIFLFFLTGGWTGVPRYFSTEECKQITQRVEDHFRKEGRNVRVVRYPDPDARFSFHSELLENKEKASELLNDAGIVWFSHYSSIDLLHEEFGLEVCGITDESTLEPIADALRSGFPHWHCSRFCCKDAGRESGWKFIIHMFPGGCGCG